jgi:biotin synthase
LPPLITFDEALALGELTGHGEIGDLVERAWEVRTANFGDATDMCSLVNAKSGGCAEDCGFCAQSRYAEADTPMHAMMEPEQILEHAQAAEAAGAHRFCMVTQGQGLSKRDFAKVLEGARLVAERTNLKRCASIGHLSADRARQLADAGIQRVHHNVETSRSYYDEVTTTVRYEGRIRTIDAVREAGMETPQPRRVAAAAGRDGVRAGCDRSDVGTDQPAQPTDRDEVRRPPADGPLGGGQVDRGLPADPA